MPSNWGRVNGVPTAPDSHGIIQGTTGPDKISGSSGDDILKGNGGGDVFYGGAGSDKFIIKNTDLINGPSSVNGIPAIDAIYDFAGAGGVMPGDNDKIQFNDFGAGSTLNFLHYQGGDHTWQYYAVHDTTTNADYTIFIHSLNGNLLQAGSDYNFIT